MVYSQKQIVIFDNIDTNKRNGNDENRTFLYYRNPYK